MKRRRPSIRTSVILGALLVAAPFVGLLAWQAYDRFGGDTRTTEAAALERAQAVASDTGRFIEASRRLLAVLAEQPAVRALDPARCGPVLVGEAAHEPAYANLLVADGSGRVVCSAVPQPSDPFSVADRPWFRQAVAADAFTIGGAQLGRITGRWVAALALPIHDGAGRLVGVIAAPVDLVGLSPVVVERPTSSAETVTLVDDAGTVLARFPDADRWIGRSAAEGEIGQLVLAGGQGTAQAHGIDGVERLYGYTSVPGTDWHAYAGIPTAEAFADVRRDLAIAALFALIALVLAVALAALAGRLIARPVRALADIAEAAAKGDLSARVDAGGFAETAVLARRFNEMLDQRGAAEAALRASEERSRLSERNLAEAQRIAGVGSWEWDAVTDVESWSDEHHRIFGIEPGTFGGTNEAFLEFVHPEDRARVEEALRLSIEEEAPYDFTHRIVRPDGAIRIVREEAEVVRDAAGHPVRMFGTVEDITERLRLEEGLRQSEHLLAEAQRIAHIGSWEWDLATDTSRWSDEHHRICGTDPATFAATADAFLSLVHPDDRARTKATERAALEDGSPLKVDFRIVRPDGAVRMIHEEGEVIRNEAGDPARMVGTVQDITERVVAEEERARLEGVLRLSERNLAEAQRIAHVGSWEWDAATDSLQASDEMCRILGTDPTTFGGTNDAFMAFVHADDRARTDEAERAALEDGAQLSFDYRIVRPDGAVRIVHQDGQVIRDEVGNPVRMVGTVQDITEQVAAEEERARLASAVEQTADSIMIQRIDGTITYVNPSFTRLYGYGSDEVVGRYAGLLNSGHHEPVFWSELWASVAAGQVWSGSIVNRRRDGTLVEVEAVISGIHDAEGQLTSFVQADRDVTRERQLESQLRQAQKMEAIGQLAGGIAHDFNNILTAIRGFGELARDPHADDRQRRADLDEVIANADRAAELTRGLLAFSRRQVLQPRVVDPAAVVDGIAPLLRRLIGERIELITSAAPGASRVQVDPSQLEQVIVNLAINARDAMPAGGRLTIETAPVELDGEFARVHPEVACGPYVVLAVSDTGVGMDPETVAHIFEPFFTTKPAGEGTGLGLATAYGFVKQSGGYIYVDSEPGAGSSFRIYLPRVEKAAAPAAAEPGPAAGVGSETVLLVEDEAAVRGLARRVLAAAGYTVLEAPDAEAALTLAAAHPGPIELLVTDVVMPGLSGPELAERLATDRPATRVLYMSGYAEDRFGDSGTLAEDIAYLPKPFTADALAHAVRDALERPIGEGRAGLVTAEHRRLHRRRLPTPV